MKNDYPRMIYVKQSGVPKQQYFQVALEEEALVGLEPVVIATYRLVEKKLLSRKVVVEEVERYPVPRQSTQVEG